MKFARLLNTTQGGVLCEHCGLADSLWTRLRGLLGRSTLPADEGLLLSPCPSIHMWGMKFAIDVVFLTREHIVTDIAAEVAPGRYYVARNQAGKPWAALELPSGAAARQGVAVGDQIAVEELSDPY
jgi:uncharacterized membrane protein (UPF0127 family)